MQFKQSLAAALISLPASVAGFGCVPFLQGFGSVAVAAGAYVSKIVPGSLQGLLVGQVKCPRSELPVLPCFSGVWLCLSAEGW